MIHLDDWQKEARDCKGDLVLVAGRQTGKTTLVAIRDGDRVMNKANEKVLIIAPTERQSNDIFNRILTYIVESRPAMLLKKAKKKPTRHDFYLTNGSSVHCRPVGRTGVGIRGMSAVTKLTIEEAEGVSDDILAVVTPMLLTTGGSIDLLGTPLGQQGYFYEAYQNKNGHYKVMHINTEKVIMTRKISDTWTEMQKEGALRHLEREKERMTKRQYQQEYLAEFVGELGRYFSENLINACCTRQRPTEQTDNKKWIGCDIARLGGDETTMEIVEEVKEEKYIHVENIVKEGLLTWQSEELIIELDKTWKNVKGIGIDAGSGALGVGIYDNLKRPNNSLSRKIEKLNNRAHVETYDDKSKLAVAKEDYYNNLKAMMEKGKIALLDDANVKMSLRSIQYEYVQTPSKASRLYIHSKYGHIVEGVIRAAWLASKSKSLNLWVSWR